VAVAVLGAWVGLVVGSFFVELVSAAVVAVVAAVGAEWDEPQAGSTRAPARSNARPLLMG